MTDDEHNRHEDASEPKRADSELTAIPDGGLGDTMPDWLRRPPVWRGLAFPDVPEPTPGPDAETETEGDPGETPGTEVDAPTPAVAEPRILPDPDRSPIDPESLIELSDLPEWLVGLGQRVPSSHADPPVTALALTTQNPSPGEQPTGDAIALRSQPAEQSRPTGTLPTGIGMRTLVIGGVIAVVVVLAILIAQFG